MSGPVFLDRQVLEIALTEIAAVRSSLPPAVVATFAEEVVLRVANNLNITPLAHLQPDPQEIDALCDALLSSDHQAAADFIEQLKLRRTSFPDMCLSFLSKAAQRLGERWDDDRVSFYRVTMAAGRIYAILRSLRMERRDPAPDLRRAAIFASVPGEDHTLGITMAADLARGMGWDIELFTGLSHDGLVATLETRQTPLIGLSASGDRSLPALIKLMVALRISNPGARILVCGQIASSHLSLVGVTGADAAADDFYGAIEQLDRLLLLDARRNFLMTDA